MSVVDVVLSPWALVAVLWIFGGRMFVHGLAGLSPDRMSLRRQVIAMLVWPLLVVPVELREWWREHPPRRRRR